MLLYIRDDGWICHRYYEDFKDRMHNWQDRSASLDTKALARIVCHMTNKLFMVRAWRGQRRRNKRLQVIKFVVHRLLNAFDHDDYKTVVVTGETHPDQYPGRPHCMAFLLSVKQRQGLQLLPTRCADWEVFCTFISMWPDKHTDCCCCRQPHVAEWCSREEQRC